MSVSPGQNVKMAVDAVWTHRFRSLLTILGVVIGIMTVVCVASLLTGLRQGIVDLVQGFGPDNVFVAKAGGDSDFEGMNVKERRRKPIDPEYVDELKRLSTSLDDAGIQVFIPNLVNGHALTANVPGKETDNVNLIGQTANINDLAPTDFHEGRNFTPAEDERAESVAVIGADIATTLFPQGKPVGRTFIVDGGEYTVVGVHDKAKGAFFGSNDQDQQISIPFSTARKKYPQVKRYMVVAKAKPGLRKQAFDEIEAILRRIRHTPKGDEDDFNLSTADQIIASFDSITGMVGIIAIAISGLGLLVGGIGVMNIMLVSVTERTREIGVRKALGARKFDIVSQFLAEAMVLTGIGGLLGIVIAVLVTLLIGALVPSLPSVVPSWAIIAGFTVSVSVGLFFGTWPAMKAAALDPVEALRYE